ncbi:probable plastid-lipid-associated protein 4, chloroplastic [Ananas comosus]|uniref:Probable plastid-lipid-associated protein 4, chloroplastic n=1 Tax=Ananas comosus TaxID=4615 RepID=A0A199V4R6_ANACO|nr:probable plastid-lipid-associated protein 4, chloroplastic [Ananas comosus]OAY72082.1 putative plastid-lipid-associated protein 4, chloroplastic [Ananas comosus]
MALLLPSSPSPSPPFSPSPLARPRRTLETPLAISRSPPSPTLFAQTPQWGARERVSPLLAAAPQESKWRTRVSFFPSFIKKRGKSREELKEELLAAIAPLDRGADAGPEDQESVDRIASELEAINPVKEPLKSDLLNGKWELLYTTSRSILQTQRPKFLRPNGKIYQAINTDTLRAQNMETWPYFNQVTANLVPLNERRVAVRFDTFKIFGLIPIKAPEGGRGELEITYLDEEIRISRGDKGNLFILKMVDPTYRVPV